MGKVVITAERLMADVINAEHQGAANWSAEDWKAYEAKAGAVVATPKAKRKTDPKLPATITGSNYPTIQAFRDAHVKVRVVEAVADYIKEHWSAGSIELRSFRDLLYVTNPTTHARGYKVWEVSALPELLRIIGDELVDIGTAGDIPATPAGERAVYNLIKQQGQVILSKIG
jgi:hypothetical protein